MKVAEYVKKYGILLWLILVTSCFVTTVTYGAYKGVTTAKRVVSLSSRDGILFSSRYMSRINTGVQPFLFTYDNQNSDEANTPRIMVDVCNYDINQNVYDKGFHFKLKARLVKTDGTDISNTEWAALSSNAPTSYSVAYASYTDTTGMLSESYSTSAITLTNSDQYIGGNSAAYYFPSADKTKYLFEVVFDLDDIKNSHPSYAVRIEAEIVEGYNDIQNIYGIMKVLQGGETTQSTWEGKYMDATVNHTPYDYDGFNYQISGNATGTVKLTYRSDMIEIDENDYGTFTIAKPSDSTTADDETFTTIYITVNPENKSMYNIRFYWLNGKSNSVSFDNFIKTDFEKATV